MCSITGGYVVRDPGRRPLRRALSPCGAAPAPAPDTRPGALAFRVTGLRRVARRHRLRADEACRARVTAHVPKVTWFRTRQRSLAARRRAVVTLRLTECGIRAVRRALRRHRTLRVVVRIRAVDGAGNVVTAGRRVRIRR